MALEGVDGFVNWRYILSESQPVEKSRRRGI